MGAAIGQGETRDVTDTGIDAAVSVVRNLGDVMAIGVRGGYAQLPLNDSSGASGKIQTFLAAPEFRVGLLRGQSPVNVYASIAPGYVHTEAERGIHGLGSGSDSDDSFGFQVGGAMSIQVASDWRSRSA